MRDAGLFLKLSWNNRAASGQTRHRRRAKPAMTRTRRAHVPSPFAATALHRKDRLPLSFSCSRSLSAAPRASLPRHRGLLACRDRFRSTQSSLPSLRLSLKLSRSFLCRFFFGNRCRCLWFLDRRFRLLGRRFGFLGASFRFLNSRTNDDVAAVRSRHRAANQNDLVHFAHLHDLQVQHGHTLVAHMARHAHVFPNAARCGTIADGAVTSMRLRSVGRALAVEVVLLHYALEAFALRTAGNIDIIARLKLRNAQIDFAFRRIGIETKFANQFFWFHAGLLEFAEQLLRHPRFFLRGEADLDRRVAFVFRSETTQQNVIARGNHGYRTQPTLRVVNAGHADFLSK